MLPALQENSANVERHRWFPRDALEGRFAGPVRLVDALRAAACFVGARFARVRVPVAPRLTVPSARTLSFLSAAFSSLRLALSRLTTLSWPSSSLPELLEHLLESRDLVFSLTQVIAQTRGELAVGGLIDQLWQ